MKQTVTITGENMNVVVNNAEAAPTAVASGTKTKAQKRMDALRAAGFDMSKFFTFGNDDIIEIKDGNAVPVDFDKLVEIGDVVEKTLVDGGYINNWSLFRRWVMAQMFRMLRDMEKNGRNFNELLQRHGYEYQWKMLEREIYAQAKMVKHGDHDNAARRSMWFNGATANAMALDYIEKLKKYIGANLVYRKDRTGHTDTTRFKHTCKGLPYIRLQNKDIFLADLQRKVYLPLLETARLMRNDTPANVLYKAIHKFNKMRKHLDWRTKQTAKFINAYKGSGAYFTMRNLIMFHGARFHDYKSRLSQSQSLSRLDDMAKDCVDSGEEWRMLGILKQLIEVSGISIQGKIDEWKKA